MNILEKPGLKVLLLSLAGLIAIVLILSFMRTGGGDHEIIYVGKNDWTGYDPLVIAESQDFFSKHDVNVSVVRFKSAGEQVRAMRDGAIQGAGLTLDEAVGLHLSGLPVKVVLVVDFSLGGDMIVGQPSITDMSMIKGKRVGFEGTLVGEFLLKRALAKSRIKTTDIELVQIKGDEWLSAFRAGQVDALVCYNPDATTLLLQDGANLLFSSQDIAFEIIDVLVFEDSFYKRNKASIVKIASAWFDAVDFIELNPGAAAQIIAKEKDIFPEEFVSGLRQMKLPDLEENRQILDGNSSDNIYKYSQVIVDFMLDKGLISRRLNTDEFFSEEIVALVGKE